MPESSRHCGAGNSGERNLRCRRFARERPSAIVGGCHHGRLLRVPSSARRKTLHFDPSCIRFDDGSCVWILHSLRPGTVQSRVGTCHHASPGAFQARCRTPVNARRANSGFRRSTVPRDVSATLFPQCGSSSGYLENDARHVCGRWLRSPNRRSCHQRHEHFQSPRGAMQRPRCSGGR